MGGFTGDGGLSFGSIGDILSGLIGVIVDILNYIWNVLVAVANFLWSAIVSVASFATSFAESTQKFFHHLWDVIFKATIAKLIVDYQRLVAWLKRVLKPLIDFINKLYAWYRKYILKWQLRINAIISKIRVILELFRLLGFKWAAKLDADLQKIQSYVTESIIAVVGTMNKISTILGLIVDPGMLIRTSAFGGTLWNNLGLVKQAAGYGSARPLFPDEKATAKSMTNAVYGTGALTTVNPDGSVTYDPALKIVDDSMTKQMQTLGIAP
jgi:hypothetical protein